MGQALRQHPVGSPTSLESERPGSKSLLHLLHLLVPPLVICERGLRALQVSGEGSRSETHMSRGMPSGAGLRVMKSGYREPRQRCSESPRPPSAMAQVWALPPTSCASSTCDFSSLSLSSLTCKRTTITEPTLPGLLFTLSTNSYQAPTVCQRYARPDDTALNETHPHRSTAWRGGRHQSRCQMCKCKNMIAIHSARARVYARRVQSGHMQRSCG